MRLAIQQGISQAIIKITFLCNLSMPFAACNIQSACNSCFRYRVLVRFYRVFGLLKSTLAVHPCLSVFISGPSSLRPAKPDFAVHPCSSVFIRGRIFFGLLKPDFAVHPCSSVFIRGPSSSVAAFSFRVHQSRQYLTPCLTAISGSNIPLISTTI
ncbi:MAG TPA: hypothetical protein PLM07_14160, partial [Candidatus Rifleibacterium sp.]|nr:hypothetical protein [Candidatus Rifleibacterium sp.]